MVTVPSGFFCKAGYDERVAKHKVEVAVQIFAHRLWLWKQDKRHADVSAVLKIVKALPRLADFSGGTKAKQKARAREGSHGGDLHAAATRDSYSAAGFSTGRRDSRADGRRRTGSRDRCCARGACAKLTAKSIG